MPDLTPLSSRGLPGLFVAAFAAGSVLPLPSEAVLAALVYAGGPTGAAVGVATLGNVLGALTLWAPARWAVTSPQGPLARWSARRREGEGERLRRALALLRRYGAPALLLSWLPVVGDAFVLAAGVARVRLVPFLLCVTLGKGLRYLAVALSAAQAR